MAIERHHFRVYFEDETTGTATADQRDIVAYEMTRKVGWLRAMDEQPITALRFIAWHSLKRTKVIEPSTTFDAWNETVVEVEAVEVEAVDPGSPEATETSSSASL